MIYFPVKLTKLYLVLFIALIAFQVILNSSKRYTATLDGYSIWKASESQYLSSLAPLPFEAQTSLINHTEEKYIFDLPEGTIYCVYLAYFLLGSAFVVSLKYKPLNPGHEK